MTAHHYETTYHFQFIMEGSSSLIADRVTSNASSFDAALIDVTERLTKQHPNRMVFSITFDGVTVHKMLDHDVCRVYQVEHHLFNAKKGCDGLVKPSNGGGVKCNKCGGWFCY